jgi:hypothetical protein
VKKFVSPGDGSIVSVDDLMYVGPVTPDGNRHKVILLLGTGNGVHQINNTWPDAESAQAFHANIRKLLGFQ